jgi:serine/threonine protein kinase
VKKLLITQDINDTLFKDEIKCLMKVKHKNIVRLLGYCSDTQGEAMKVHEDYVLAETRQRLLCFEYVPNGNLHNYIKGICSLRIA